MPKEIKLGAKKIKPLPKGIIQVSHLAKQLGIAGSNLGQQIGAEVYNGVRKKFIDTGKARISYVTNAESAIIRRAHKGLQISRTFNKKVIADTSRKNVATTFLGNLSLSHPLRRQVKGYSIPVATRMGTQVYFRPSQRQDFTRFVGEFKTLREAVRKLNVGVKSPSKKWDENGLLEHLRAGAWPKIPWGEVAVRKGGNAYTLAFIHKTLLSTAPARVEIKEEHRVSEIKVIEKQELPETHIPLQEAMEIVGTKKAAKTLETQLSQAPKEIITDVNGRQYVPRELAFRVRAEYAPKEKPAVVKDLRSLGIQQDDAHHDGLHLFNNICLLKTHQMQVLNAIKLLSNDSANGESQEAKHALVKLLIAAGGPASPAGKMALEVAEQAHANALSLRDPLNKFNGIDGKRLLAITRAFGLATIAINDIPNFKKMRDMPDLTPAQRRADVLQTYLHSTYTPTYKLDHKLAKMARQKAKKSKAKPAEKTKKASKRK